MASGVDSASSDRRYVLETFLVHETLDEINEACELREYDGLDGGVFLPRGEEGVLERLELGRRLEVVLECDHPSLGSRCLCVGIGEVAHLDVVVVVLILGRLALALAAGSDDGRR
jgi:hypothetical protein